MFTIKLLSACTLPLRLIIKPRPLRCIYSTRINQSSISEKGRFVNAAKFDGKSAPELDGTEDILDVYKERLKYSHMLEEIEEEPNTFGDLNLNHGINGVFDIEDLVETLKHQQAEDIFVAVVPKDIKYADYIVVASGKSVRHMQAITQFVRRVYKQKKHENDIVPKLEGADSLDWKAMDMGNIALHIFSKSAREQYDLDTLWAVGHKYDDECNKKEAVSSALENYTLSLRGLEPAE